jgi:hypothetical protein
MMMNKLVPDQLEQLWDSIRYGLISSLAKTSEEILQNILCQLLKGEMQCWCFYDDDKKIYGYIVTSIITDSNTKDKSLLIYSLFLYKRITADIWKKGITSLNDFAKENGCNMIEAWSINDNAISIAFKLGFKEQRYLTKEVS